MCTYYYLHYHHTTSCTRDVEYTVQYSFCKNSTLEFAINSPLRPLGLGASAGAGANIGLGLGWGLVLGRSIGVGMGMIDDAGARDLPGGDDQQLFRQPCDELTPAPEYNPAIGVDYINPCVTGGCLESQHCASGGCRLDELGGRWVCCRCSRGGNTFRWCVHPVRKVPDALCYHVVCRNCRIDR